LTGTENRRSVRSPQIEIGVEISERQLAQRAVDGLAPAASRVVRLGDGTPASVLAKDRDHVVGVVLGFKIEQQRRISVGAQRRRGKDGAFEAVRGLLGQHSPRRPRRIRKVIGSIVEKFLDAVRTLSCCATCAALCGVKLASGSLIVG
jgi:hypothetical protein